jgi:hypothetical protein
MNIDGQLGFLSQTLVGFLYLPGFGRGSRGKGTSQERKDRWD